jgi:hypothetical protein
MLTTMTTTRMTTTATAPRAVRGPRHAAVAPAAARRCRAVDAAPRRRVAVRNTPAGAGDVEPASPLGVFRLEYDISKVRAGAARRARGAMRAGNGRE